MPSSIDKVTSFKKSSAERLAARNEVPNKEFSCSPSTPIQRWVEKYNRIRAIKQHYLTGRMRIFVPHLCRVGENAETLAKQWNSLYEVSGTIISSVNSFYKNTERKT
ncbi:hypothetical protein CEXT_683511 [Caerostris extrusa]|uniref:Transposase n=1 Tax=Caerostris extrusa TaxID=172846 RepID=A0AAV4NIQ9_CAEEX|nr:hypothetical protein CEXT_683511 [Caerostris extrusa]